MRGRFFGSGASSGSGATPVAVEPVVVPVERAVDESAKQEILRAKQDQLLELYTQWQAAPSSEIEESVKRLVGEIQEITPSFRFALPKGGAMPRRRSETAPGSNTSTEAVAGSSPPAAPASAPQTPPAHPSASAARSTGPTNDSTATGVAPDPEAKKRPRGRKPRPPAEGDASTN